MTHFGDQVLVPLIVGLFAAPQIDFPGGEVAILMVLRRIHLVAGFRSCWRWCVWTGSDGVDRASSSSRCEGRSWTRNRGELWFRNLCRAPSGGSAGVLS